jgi:hypothetical protein
LRAALAEISARSASVVQAVPSKESLYASRIDRHRLAATLFLVAAAASFVLSITLWFTDNRQEGVFVGLWVPSILAAGAFWTVAMGRDG